ncbi:hypothetical protein [Rhodococcus qingshengii]|uniref:hypothetical protein n=1 Tax=Rhodococcus qingshengii TaxID=334542 RepID=UPI001AE0E119|nr:hypothetical protein [Rhodococcus qingshengii]MCQ4148663.1 hypothetical protein [Rhodococcus qingshengii]
MIEKFAAAWPSLRKVIYIMLAAGLAVAFTYGKVDAAQQASILESATQFLGFVGFVIAILYTPKGGKTIGDGTDTPVTYTVNDLAEARNKMWSERITTEVTKTQPSVTIPLPSVEQIAAAAAPTISELRSRLEQSLGQRPEG